MYMLLNGVIICGSGKMYLRSTKFFGLDSVFAAYLKRSAARLVKNRVYVLDYCLGTYRNFDSCRDQCRIAYVRHCCTSTRQGHLSWEGSTHDLLLKTLESALRDCKDDEVWGVFSKFKSLYGFPPPSIISKLISGLSYSSDDRSLPRACSIVYKLAKENSTALRPDCLSRLCLSLARAQMPIPASKILRFMLQKNMSPTMDVLSSVFMHLVKTNAGTHMASNVLLEFCDRFHYLSTKKSECAIAMKPSTTIFNLVLQACVRFGFSLKGEQIIQAMAHMGVVADVHSVLLFTYIYEMNGQKDEMKKLKEYVDRVSCPLARYYDQFYDKFLSLLFKFDDVDAAASLVSDIYFLWSSRPWQQNEDLMKPCLVPFGSPYLKNGLKVQVIFELLQKDSVFSVTSEVDFVVFKNGRLTLTSKGWAQLIVNYKRSNRISELSKLLAAIEKEMGACEEGSLCCDVIHACIHTGFLEAAHDILDDMEIANVPVPTSTYILLLNAYCREKMNKEAEALAKQIRSLGLPIDMSDEIIVSKCLSGEPHVSRVSIAGSSISRQSELTAYLVQETKRQEKALSKVYELNSSIFFFFKAKMVEDARNIYRKMKIINIQPTVQTFAYLIQGYSSLENYREITILWGDMKRYMDRGCSLVNSDLFELLLVNFLRGGYFERVLEVIGLMKEHGMYADRWMYKHEFLRFHKSLYRRLKATDARTEAQQLRIEHVKAFRAWVRNN